MSPRIQLEIPLRQKTTGANILPVCPETVRESLSRILRVQVTNNLSGVLIDGAQDPINLLFLSFVPLLGLRRSDVEQ